MGTGFYHFVDRSSVLAQSCKMYTANWLVFSIYPIWSEITKSICEQHVMFISAIRQNVSIGKSSFNIYKNTQLKKPKYPNKYLLEMLNTQLIFAIPKWMKKEWVTYPIVQKINKGTDLCKLIKPRDYKTIFMLNITEHHIHPTHKC